MLKFYIYTILFVDVVLIFRFQVTLLCESSVLCLLLRDKCISYLHLKWTVVLHNCSISLTDLRVQCFINVSYQTENILLGRHVVKFSFT